LIFTGPSGTAGCRGVADCALIALLWWERLVTHHIARDGTIAWVSLFHSRWPVTVGTRLVTQQASSRSSADRASLPPGHTEALSMNARVRGLRNVSRTPGRVRRITILLAVGVRLYVCIAVSTAYSPKPEGQATACVIMHARAFSSVVRFHLSVSFI
jgi:hypothetical protein